MKFNGKLFIVVEFQHVKPGKGPAFVRTKLRNLETGKILENTFSAGHAIDVIRVENRPYQFLYEEGDGYHLMHTDTFEQIFINKELIDRPQYLREGMVVNVLTHAEEEYPIRVDLPDSIEAEVTYTEPGLKGDTATNTLKPATIDTGAQVKVPLFIDTGDKIKVDTNNGVYLERLK